MNKASTGRAVAIGISSAATVVAALISIAGCLGPFWIFFARRSSEVPPMDAAGLECVFPGFWGVSIAFGFVTYMLAKATIETVRGATRGQAADAAGAGNQ